MIIKNYFKLNLSKTQFKTIRLFPTSSIQLIVLNFLQKKVVVKTDYRPYRSERFIPMIIGVVAGALALLFIGAIAVFNMIKGAQMSSRVLEIQRSLCEINEQLLG